MARSRKPQSASEFENPAMAEPAAGPAPEATFDDPEGTYESEGADVAASSAEAELTVPLSASDSGLMQIKAAIESLLIRQAGPMVEGAVMSAESLSGTGNIQGVGYALGDPSSAVEPGQPSLVVFTADPASEDEVKGLIANAVAATDEDLTATRLSVVHSGLIEAYPHRFKARPAPCGVSVGHFQITAGTIGALARGRSGDRRNRLFVLSNNHVLANTNAGPLGARCCNPAHTTVGSIPATGSVYWNDSCPSTLLAGHRTSLTARPPG
jgi:hypothetical protein